MNGSQKCDKGAVTATGTFRTNGKGGTVYYGWVRKDATGTHVIPEPGIVVAAGDTGSHAVVSDSWVPTGPGPVTEQLVFVSPGYQSPATPPAPTSMPCR